MPWFENKEEKLREKMEILVTGYPEIGYETLRQDLLVCNMDVETCVTRLDAAIANKGVDPNNLVWYWAYTDTVSRDEDEQTKWHRFTWWDSAALEGAKQEGKDAVAVDHGRFTVNMDTLAMTPVYWEETEPRVVRRGQWYKKIKNTLVPLRAAKCEILEANFTDKTKWGQVFDLQDDQAIINGYLAVFFYKEKSEKNPITLQRGLTAAELKNLRADDKLQPPPDVENLVFVVHGIGANWDTKGNRGDSMQILVEQVDLMREKVNYEATRLNRPRGCIEFLPINWHKHLHAENDDVTLQRGSRILRDFANDAIVDILYYMEPSQCQVIMDSIASTINSMHTEFMRQHPGWKGKISILGHSLGSIASYDLLMNQKPDSNESVCQTEEQSQPFETPVCYPALDFPVESLVLLGSPVGLFLSVRQQQCGSDLTLPTCQRVFNVFHPYDPVAYRIEPLMDTRWAKVEPVYLPHQGGQRVHVMLRDTVKRIKKFGQTWNFAESLKSVFSKEAPDSASRERPSSQMEEAFEEWQHSELVKECQTRTGSAPPRIDYQIQESPSEFNELLFAIQSHTSYWGNVDVACFLATNLLGLAEEAVVVEDAASSSPAPSAPAPSKVVAPENDLTLSPEKKDE